MMISSVHAGPPPCRLIRPHALDSSHFTFQKIRLSATSGAQSRKRRIPIAIMVDAAAWFFLRFFTIVVLGVPVQSILKHPKSMDAPWIWSFWFRLPIVVGFGYGIYPWWSSRCREIFQPTGDLLSGVSTVFAPLTALLYAALAGYAVVSLWSRLEKVRSSLHQEFALLEILEKRIPKESEDFDSFVQLNQLKSTTVRQRSHGRRDHTWISGRMMQS